MDAKQFSAEFAHIANAPGSISKLRELILQLAASGDLIHVSNPIDAAPLLTAIDSRKRKHPERKKVVAKQAPVSPNTLAVPQHWVNCRLGDLTLTITGGGTPSKGQSAYWNGDIPWASVKDMKELKYLDDTEDHVTREGLENSSSNLIPPNSIIVCTRMGLGKIAINRVPMAINQDLKALELPPEVDPDFFLILYKTRKVKGTGTTVHGIKQDELLALPVALPPLEEQSRIVSKVDELMSLCDKLETQQQARRELRDCLRESILQAITGATSPHELQTTWTRLAANFGRLFHTPEDVAQLKSVVLSLAMRGLLVEQVPTDTPALNLLQNIARERQQLVASGRLKAAISIPSPEEGELPYLLPKGWIWARVIDLVDVGTGATPAKSETSYYGGNIPWYTSSATNDKFARAPETFISEKAIRETNCKIFPAGSLIIALYGQGKTRGQISELTIAGATNQAIAAMVFLKSSLKVKHYLKYYFEKIYQEIRLHAEGGPQPNLNLGKIKETFIPVPPEEEQARIVAKLNGIFELCDRFSRQLSSSAAIAKKLVTTSITSITGITIQQEEKPVKTPQTELIAPLRLGIAPNIKAQAPLATLLVRHNGEMSAKDLWQRFGGEIDAFYAQLKTEVTHGWIKEPAVAEMREKHIDAVST
jgi:type I restriction enzyme S subunit